MTRRLAREKGIFAGASSGANVVAAIRVAQRLGPDATVATPIVDSGLRYLITDIYRNSGAYLAMKLTNTHWKTLSTPSVERARSLSLMR